MTTLLIQTALWCEASPFIDGLKLQPSRFTHKQQFFFGSGIALVVGGIGKLKASIATSDLVDWASEQGIPGAEIIFINFGLCGARPDCRRGSLYQVNQIIDSNTRTTHLVGTMPNVTLPTAALTTTPHAQSDHTRLNTELVDMEAAAIWEVLKSKLPNSPALCLKLVTDHCNPKDCNYQSAQTLLKPLLPQLCELAQSLRSYRLTGEL